MCRSAYWGTSPPTLSICTAGLLPQDQKWDSTAGLVFNERRGGWLSLNAEYGSGLSQDPANCNGNTFNCKVPPHLVFNAAKGFALRQRVTLAISVDNVFNDRYALTLNNALQGTHYARPRAVFVTLDLK